ncbi:unnamed protein product [Rotaria magnacalcarata]
MSYKTFLSEFPTFNAQYAIELLHSLNSTFDSQCSTNENLRNIMLDLAKRDDNCFYETALRAYRQLQNDKSHDLTTIFNNKEFNDTYNFCKKERENSNTTKSYKVANVHVTPTSTCIMPLEATGGHRALRHKDFNGVNDFCLVYLKPDSGAKYIKKCDRYQRVFQSGIEICNNCYHAFGASNSQLRESSYWFIRAKSREEAHEKRQKFGDFSRINNVGKYVARLGLWFSTTHSTGIELTFVPDPKEFNNRVEQGDQCVTIITDIERNGYLFTDGNGLISKGLARIIAERLDYLVKSEQNELYPSAYQIRMAGCKGLVIIDPDSNLNQYYIKIRSSMNKIPCDDWNLDICESSQPIPHSLNNQIIVLLSDLGIPDSVFLELQDQWFTNKDKALSSTEKLLKNKIPLPLNECRYMFGCALESTLEQGQCFIRYQILNDDGKPFEIPKFETVVGPVIITKNPCSYAGDIIKLEAVDISELACLQDVLVFSTKGYRPDCSKIAGSDLDGDQYFVYWGRQLQISETITPLEYNTLSASVCSTCITSDDIINYWLSLLGATSYGEIFNLHAIVVDKNKEHYPKRTCQPLAIELADMFSAAIDSGKTGYQINKDRIKEIRKIVGSTYPDFLMKKPSYQSQSILGILYRRAADLKKANSNSSEDHETDSSKTSCTQADERNFRFYVKVRTALNVDPYAIHQELLTVFDTKVPSKILIEAWCDYYKKKNSTTSGSMESSIPRSVEDIDEAHSLCNTSLQSSTTTTMGSDTNE